ncbi:MAG: hypothetical protein ACE14T_11265, partial [Syntrophales bacterium]
MKSRLCSILTIIVFCASVLSCASVPEQYKGAATGAGVGGATGAVAGAVLGRGSVESTVLGGLLGALVGGAVGHYAYDVKRSRAETAQQYNYQPSSGTVLKIENASATPQTVKPGDTVNLMMTYAVLTPSPDTQINVTESRTIKIGDEIVGQPQVNVERKGGTYTSTIPITLPPTAQKGTYTVTETVQSAGVKDTRETTFNV